jgi:NADH-quinone oxidoreductase subunit A
MLIEYIPVFVLLAIALVTALAFLFLSEWLGARRTTKEKQTTYESGMIPFGTARERFSVKFYLVAVSFIVFDIEVVFLYPWAVQFLKSSPAGIVAMLIFLITLFIGYFYELRKGGFEWE